MSDWKVGDELAPKDASNASRWSGCRKRTVKHVGESWVLYDLIRPNGTAEENVIHIHTLNGQFKKVVPFFEPGKKYRYASGVFECKYVEQDSDGAQVALGTTSWSDGGKFWDIRKGFDIWKEVE